MYPHKSIPDFGGQVVGSVVVVLHQLYVIIKPNLQNLYI